MAFEKLGSRDRKTRAASNGGKSAFGVDTSAYDTAAVEDEYTTKLQQARSRIGSALQQNGGQPAGQNGIVPKGDADPGENQGAQTDKRTNRPAGGVLAIADLRPEGGNEYFYGTAGRPPERRTWQTERARLEAKQAAVHEQNLKNQAARSKALQDSIKQNLEASKAREQAVMNGTDLSSLRKITDQMWSNWGGMDGSQKDKDGKPIGGMVDATRRAGEISAINSWLNTADAKAFASGLIPKGVALRRTENGVKSDKYSIDPATLTNTQLDALLRIKANTDERFAGIRGRAEKYNQAKYDSDMNYLVGKGFRPEFDKSTGKMLTSREEIARMARTYRMNDARAALGALADPETRDAARANFIKAAADLGFRTSDIFTDDGSASLDPDKIGRLLAANRSAAPATPAAPAAVARTPSVAPASRRGATGTPAPSRDVTYPTITSPLDALRNRSADPFVKAGLRIDTARVRAAARSAVPAAPAATEVPAAPAAPAPAAPAGSPLFAGLGGAMTDTAGFATIRGKYNPNAATLRDEAYRRGMAGAIAAGALTGADLGLTLTGAGGLVRAGVGAVARKTVMKATAKGLANPAVRGAAKQLAKESSGTAAQNTMAAIDRFARSNPARRRAIDAAQKAADIRKANAAAEAAKTGADKTMDAVGNFWSRVSRAKPKRRVR